MNNFVELKDLPILDLESELTKLLIEDKIHWNHNNSICINTLSDHPDNYEIGTGSLWKDWDKAQQIEKPDGSIEIVVPDREVVPLETDFNILCSVFKNTLFEEVYNSLKNRYNGILGRVRLMKMKPKTCLTWHQDGCARIHYPVKTQQGCLMIIENEIKYMPKYTWWFTNTLPYHTAINASTSERIHLVCSVEL